MERSSINQRASLPQRRHISFKMYIKRLKTILLSDMQLSMSTLEEIEDFLAHMMRKVLRELSSLSKLKGRNTLGVHEIDCAVKLSLPSRLYEFAATFARNAVLRSKVKIESSVTLLSSISNDEYPEISVLQTTAFKHKNAEVNDGHKEVSPLKLFGLNVGYQDLGLLGPIDFSIGYQEVSPLRTVILNSGHIKVTPPRPIFFEVGHQEASPLKRAICKVGNPDFSSLRLISSNIGHTKISPLKSIISNVEQIEVCSLRLTDLNVTLPEVSPARGTIFSDEHTGASPTEPVISNIRRPLRLTERRILQKRRKLIIPSYEIYIKKVKKLLLPDMQLSKSFLMEIDHFLIHMTRLVEGELKNLSNLKRRKTLRVEQIECAIKLCLPRKLSEFAMVFARQVVSFYKSQEDAV